ncbi:MAG: hypothetical protein NVS4B5_14890 [Vulcanimicrobiaceae bacterium]
MEKRQVGERVDTLLATLSPTERAKLHVLDLPALNGSATLVRAQLARGGSVRYLVPESVYRYIAEHGPYAPGALASSTTSNSQPGGSGDSAERAS